MTCNPQSRREEPGESPAFLWAWLGCAATRVFRDLATDQPITLDRAPGSAPTPAAWLEFSAGGPGPDLARGAIGPAMPAGAPGETLYLAKLAGVSWPRSEGRVLGGRGEGGGGGGGKASAAGR